MLNAVILSEQIVLDLQAKGFNISHEHARSKPFIDAIAKAVVEHIQQHADVVTVDAQQKVQ